MNDPSDPHDPLSWLEVARAARWSFAYHPNRKDVQALAVYRTHHPCAIDDVAILVDDARAYGYRGMRTSAESTNVFAPDLVLWVYEESPVRVLRAMLALPAPGEPQAPVNQEPAPPALTQLAAQFARERSLRLPD